MLRSYQSRDRPWMRNKWGRITLTCRDKKRWTFEIMYPDGSWVDSGALYFKTYTAAKTAAIRTRFAFGRDARKRAKEELGF